MKPSIRLPIAATIAALLSGCVTAEGNFNHIRTDDGKCLTCINNPITGKPWNHDGPGVAPLGTPEAKEQIAAERARQKAVVAQQPPQYDEHKRIFVVPSNVDIAYIRVKKEFNYYDLEQVKAEHGRAAWQVMQDPRFKYEALPSVFYKMRDYREHNGTGLTIDTEILKKTDATSEVTLRYWLPEGTSDHNKNHYGEGLQERIIKAVQGNG